MTIPSGVKRLALPFTAFLLVGGGTLLALPEKSPDTGDARKEPTVVAVDAMTAGTPSLEVRSRVEIRDIDVSARADGALSSIDQIPDGVLTANHVPGQQILLSSIAENVVAAVGPGYVSVSVRLDSQRWMGPVGTTGTTVNVYSITNGVSSLISEKAVILDAPEVADLKPRDDAIITLAVRRDSLGAVLVAATEDRLWLTGR